MNLCRRSVFVGLVVLAAVQLPIRSANAQSCITLTGGGGATCLDNGCSAGLGKCILIGDPIPTECVCVRDFTRRPRALGLVGTNGSGVADAKGMVEFYLEDTQGAPVVGAPVTLVLSGCSTARLGSVQQAPGMTTNCAEKSVTVFTGSGPNAGIARFTVSGSELASTCGPIPAGCGRVRIGDVDMGPIVVASYDKNGSGGVNSTDLALFLQDLFGCYRERSDHNGDLVINAADLSSMLAVLLGGGSLITPLSCP